MCHGVFDTKEPAGLHHLGWCVVYEGSSRYCTCFHFRPARMKLVVLLSTQKRIMKLAWATLWFLGQLYTWDCAAVLLATAATGTMYYALCASCGCNCEDLTRPRTAAVGWDARYVVCCDCALSTMHSTLEQHCNVWAWHLLW